MKKLKQAIMLGLLCVVCSSVQAASLRVTSNVISLDTMQGVREVQTLEEITYSTQWVSPAADVTVTVEDLFGNVTELVSATGHESGTVVWNTKDISAGQSFFLKHRSGAQLLTAQFTVSLDPGLAYTVANGAVTITGYTGNGTDVKIPRIIAGLPVTKIAYPGFANNETLEKVTIPDTVTEIAANAFAFCSSLSEVYFEGDQPTIGANAFIMVATGAKGYCWNYHTDWMNTFAEQGMEVAGLWMYVRQEVTFNTRGGMPEEMTRVYLRSWWYDTFPPTPVRHGYDFEGWFTDERFTTQIDAYSIVDAEHTTLYARWSYNDFAYYKDDDGMVIIGYTGRIKHLSIPEELDGYPVVEIRAEAFEGNTLLEKVVIPASVTKIGANAFKNCDNLVEVYFEGQKPAIGSDAFLGVSVEAIGYCWETNTTWLTNLRVPYLEMLIQQMVAFDGMGGEPELMSLRYVRGKAYSVLPDAPARDGYDFVGWFTDDLFSTQVMPSTLVLATHRTLYAQWGLDNFAYYKNTDNGIVITGYAGTRSNLSIPHYIDGYPVTEIRSGALRGNMDLESVTIPATVTTIGTDAFLGCTNLKAVHFDGEKPTIGANAFLGVDDNAEGYCWVENTTWLYNINVSNLDVFIKQKIYFYGMGGVPSQAIYPFVRWKTFADLPNAPARSGYDFVGWFTDRTFTKQYTEDMIVEATHTVAYAQWSKDDFAYYATPEGIVVTEYMGHGSDLIIPSEIDGMDVATIRAGAFAGNTALETLTIPATVTVIEDEAFMNCINLREVNFEGERPTIGADAFLGIDAGALGYCWATCTSWEANLAIEGIAMYLKQLIAFNTQGGSPKAESRIYVRGMDYGALPPNPALADSVFCGWYADAEYTDYVEEDALVQANHKILYARWLSTDYQFDETESQIFITGYLGSDTEIVIPSHILKKPVTIIKAQAFLMNATISSVVIPDTVIAIEDFAFYSCTALERVLFEGNRPYFGETPFDYLKTDAVGYYAPDKEGWFAGEQIGGLRMLGSDGWPETVPEAWFAEQGITVQDGDYLAAALVPSPVGKVGADGKPLLAWQEYVQGTNPLDKDDTFSVTSIVCVDGAWEIAFEPNLNADGTSANDRLYTLEGCETLGGEWSSMNLEEAHFFRVKVEMP